MTIHRCEACGTPYGTLDTGGELDEFSLSQVDEARQLTLGVVQELDGRVSPVMFDALLVTVELLYQRAVDIKFARAVGDQEPGT